MATFRVVDEDGDWYETDGDPAVRFEQMRAEREADAAAVAALLHWVRQDYDAGQLRVGALTSSALVALEDRFAERIAAVNASLAAAGRRTWDVRR